MTVKVISSFIDARYTLNGAKYTGLAISATGGVDGSVEAPSYAYIENYGTIIARYSGVILEAGGSVVNKGLITGSFGVIVHGSSGTVTNVGTILVGVDLTAGGVVLNRTGALIGSEILITGAAGTVTNYGAITSEVVVGDAGAVINDGAITLGVEVVAGGEITNGSSGDLGASITGYGASLAGGGAVTNFGVITASAGHHGLDLTDGGALVNGGATDQTALIKGNLGVYAAGAATVTNFGSLVGTVRGASLDAGGQLINGSAGDRSALIIGANGFAVAGAASVINFGTIQGTDATPGRTLQYGVYLNNGGSVTNGAATDVAAMIEGYSGVIAHSGAATISNFGSIIGDGATDRYGVDLESGGRVTNGSKGDSHALIEGAFGVVFGAAGAVTNYGSIDAAAGYGVAVKTGAGAVTNLGTILNGGGDGVFLGGGGNVLNGGSEDWTALIQGYGGGVSLAASGSVTNYGAIENRGGDGVHMAGGGMVVNGGGADRSSLIRGTNGVVLYGSGSIANFGTVVGTEVGVDSAGSATVSNGSATNSTARIEGQSGVFLQAGAVANLGTILGLGDFAGYGVEAKAGKVINGASGHSAARIEGYTGVGLTGAGATLVNFGVIAGDGGTAVLFNDPTDVLLVEAGSSFIGAIKGDGGTLELGSGVGTISLLARGSVTVSGSMATTTFAAFGTVKVDAGASFTAAGAQSSAAGESLVVAGTLAAASTLTIAGALTTTGTLAGTGNLALAGGSGSFNNGTALAIAKVTETGAATATIGVAALAYAGVWTQSAGTISVLAGDRINFTGAADLFAGTLSGAGTVAFTGGSDAFNAATLTASSVIINTAKVTLSGAITIAHQLTASTANLVISAGGAALTGGGTLALTNSAGNIVYGTVAAATLSNVNDRILGAGFLGNGALTLVNDSGGLIDGDDPAALTIDTGAATITNAGIIEATGTGGVTIKSAIDNTGTLRVTTATLLMDGAVSGSGRVQIGGGTADFATVFSENVFFTGSTGVLELAKSQTYTGQVTGFSKTGGTSFDLLDISFGSKTSASFAGTTTSGTLTVTDGTHTAKIVLEGDYTAQAFTVSSDSHGGTRVADPHKPATLQGLVAPPLHQFVTAAAAASVGAGSGWTRVADKMWGTPRLALAIPRGQIL